MNRICILVAAALAGCGGTTGSGLVAFRARAGGVEGAAEFDSGSGYHVTLSRAALHIGAVYLNESVPSSGGPELPCLLPGIYVGEVFGGVDLDLLSTTLVPFPTTGEGTMKTAKEADVWLTGGDVNAPSDPTPILDVAGTAARGDQTWPFTATVTISTNRQIPPATPSMPGSNPICRQRIVSLIPVNLDLFDGGTLDVRVDVRPMFAAVDFALLPQDGVIPDQNGGIGGALFKGVTTTAPYVQMTFTQQP
jgi:hypothetical protein